MNRFILAALPLLMLGLAAGADAYLVKPFSARELLAHVEAHLELGRLRASLAQERAEATAELHERKRVEAALRARGCWE